MLLIENICSILAGVLYSLTLRGQDLESPEMLRQGFTHAFLTTFDKKEDYTVFVGHPKHQEFSATFSTVLEKIVLLDFPATLVKPPPKAPAEEPPATPNDQK